MKPKFRDADLDAEVVFDRYLGAEDELDLIQELLREAAPRWCAQLRVWRSPRDQRPIDLAEPGVLRGAVLVAAGERGPTYRALVERYGAGDERLFGSVELRGAGSELIVIISVDDRVVSRLGEKAALGNHLAFQVRRPEVAGRSGAVWVGEVFEAFCGRLSPVWGQAGHPDEYWAKVISERPSIAAVGRDFGRFLPGVFWLNFFGRRYRELFGEDRLRSTPASRIAVVDDGVLVGLGLKPSRWDTPEYAGAEQRIRDHLGPEAFSKAEPDRPTVAPDWSSSSALTSLVEVMIDRAVPRRPIGPWSRRVGAPEASAPKRERQSCRAVCNGLPTRPGHRGRASPCGQGGPTAPRKYRVVLTGRATRVP